MTDTKDGAATVIVGIDGSPTAVQAALWALTEATHRDLPLRLVYSTASRRLCAQDYRDEITRAKAALHEAHTALIAATDQPVHIETVIVDGPPAPALIEQSRGAALICVGSVGIGRYARSVIGSTATELADKAGCPVAIICPPQQHTPEHTDWIVVALAGTPEQDAVMESALTEATVRQMPVLAVGERHDHTGLSSAELDSEIERWRARYPDVHIYPISVHTDVAHFLATQHEQVQLTVIGAEDTPELAEILGRYHHSRSSVLVVRN